MKDNNFDDAVSDLRAAAERASGEKVCTATSAFDAEPYIRSDLRVDRRQMRFKANSSRHRRRNESGAVPILLMPKHGKTITVGIQIPRMGATIRQFWNCQ